MKTLFRLAKTELSILFYSPIAWLILVIFTFQAGMEFSELFESQVRSQVLGYSTFNVTYGLLGGAYGLFSAMQGNLYLYIPLLTMGLMSREYSSGSIKLLYSSPVTNIQIILGKYLSMMIYGLILMFILFIPVLFSGFTVEAMDWPLALSGLLALYLLTCAYAAIGLFMSALTSYQVVAAMGTLAVLAVLNFIGNVGQSIALVRDITYWLSISGRANEMISGLLCSEDVIYFLVVMVLFIALSILKLQSQRKKRPVSMTLFRYVSVIVIALAIGYISRIPQLMFFHDATATKMKTLAAESQEVMKQMDGGLTITTYVNLLDNNYRKGMPDHINYDKRDFKQYLRFKPEIKMKYVYYYDHTPNPWLDRLYPNMNDEERARELMKVDNYNPSMFLTPEEIRKTIDLSGEDNRFVRLLERENGRKTFLRLFDDNMQDPTETEITAALKRLVVDVPKVGFLTTHGEREIKREGERDYSHFAQRKNFRYSLINMGFDVVPLTLEEAPEDIDIIVVSEMRSPLTDKELYHLEDYIARGGNMLILGEPGRQEVMNPVVRSLGITFLPGIVVESNEFYSPDLLIGEISQEANDMFPGYRYLKERGYRFAFPGTTALSWEKTADFRMAPLVLSNASRSWNELETTDFRDNLPTINPAMGEENGTYPLVVSLTRQKGEKEQRILVFGDSDCISNGELKMPREDLRTANYSLVMESFRFLANDVFPVKITRPHSKDNAVNAELESIVWMKIAFIGIFPLILLACWISLWMKRRRK